MAATPLFLTPLMDGISWGLMLVLISIGLTLIFGFLEVVNFAHGAYYMLGGYVLFTLVNAGQSFYLGLLAAFLVVGILGAITEMGLLRPSYDFGPIPQMLIMVGVVLVIDGLVVMVWGNQAKGVDAPAAFDGSIHILGSTYPMYRLSVAVLALVIILAVWLYLQRSKIGLVIRASLTDKEMAYSLGNDIPRIYTLVFATGVALAALGGALMTPIRGIGPGTGGTIILQAFIVVVVGGLGSFRGTVVAGISIAMLDVLMARYVSPQLSGLTMIGVLLIVLVFKPRGLYGEVGVMEE